MRQLIRYCAIAAATLAVSPLVQAAPGSRRLSLDEAINDALNTNVQTLLARARQDEAAGNRATARSAFLPHLSAQVSQSRRQSNLVAQGFEFNSDVLGDQAPLASNGQRPIFPTFITYNNFDARARLRQTLFDYSAWQHYKSARLGEQAADARVAVAREQVATQAALDYVALLAANQALAAAQADLTQAARLLGLARDQANVGMATGVDVTRARARQARYQAQLAQAQTDRTRAMIQLARTTGITLGSNLELGDPLVFRPMALGAAGTVVSQALANRPEITLARTRVDRGETDLASARGERLPTLSLNADYGASGNTPSRNDRSTYSVGAELNLPLFDGGAISGDIDSAASRLDQQRVRLHDTQLQVEQDVLTARQSLSTLADQVRAARSGLTLAKEELSRSRDRFQHGVGDNVAVIDAQTSLANARNTRINALAEYTRARINLAAALGRAQQFSLTQPMTP